MDRISRDIQSVIRNRDLFGYFSNSTIFITGATGFIGSMLIKTLVSADEKLGLHLKIKGQIRNHEKAINVFGNMIDKIELVTTDDVETDYIIHTVSPTTSKYFMEHPVETIKASVESTISILDIAKKQQASVVYLSSMEQYGIPYNAGEKMSEDKIGVINHLNIRSSYSEAKRLCECLCVSYVEEYGVDVKIARLAQTVGAGVNLIDNRMPMQFAKAAANQQDIILHTDGNSISNYVYLTDAIVGILTILKKGEKGQAYNVCNDKESRCVREIAELVCHEVANNKIDFRIELKDNMGYAPNVAMYLDSGKLRRLGWCAEVSMVEGYKRLIEYIKEHDVSCDVFEE